MEWSRLSKGDILTDGKTDFTVLSILQSIKKSDIKINVSSNSSKHAICFVLNSKPVKDGEIVFIRENGRQSIFGILKNWGSNNPYLELPRSKYGDYNIWLKTKTPVGELVDTILKLFK